MRNEIVLYRGESSRQSHKALFALADSCYIPLGHDIIGDIFSAAGEGITKLHILAGWEEMLKVALWSSARPTHAEVFSLMKRASVDDAELAPFRDADINDIFPSLYYGKRFDILRKVCHAAKAKAEAKISKKNLLVYCHLASEDVSRIVASNL